MQQADFKPGALVLWHHWSSAHIAARIVKMCEVFECGKESAGGMPGAELEMMDPDFTKSGSHLWRNEFAPLADMKLAV